MTVPTCEKLDDARPLEGFRFGKKGLLGVQVGRSGAGVQFGQLRVTNGSRKTQDQREDDPRRGLSPGPGDFQVEADQ